MNDSNLNSSNNSKTIVVIGDKETGKTNLLLRFVKKKFYENYETTKGMKYIYSRHRLLLQRNKFRQIIQS
jgi:GTPase SAR1 family protein